MNSRCSKLFLKLKLENFFYYTGFLPLLCQKLTQFTNKYFSIANSQKSRNCTHFDFCFLPSWTAIPIASVVFRLLWPNITFKWGKFNSKKFFFISSSSIEILPLRHKSSNLYIDRSSNISTMSSWLRGDKGNSSFSNESDKFLTILANEAWNEVLVTMVVRLSTVKSWHLLVKISTYSSFSKRLILNLRILGVNFLQTKPKSTLFKNSN